MDITPLVFTSDYTGVPGERTFFLQARSDDGTHTFRIEKTQVELLAEKLNEMLITLDPNDTIKGQHPARDPALDFVEEPPLWRVGSMALAHDASGDRIVVMIAEVDSEEEDDDEDEADANVARFFLRKDQVRSFVLHSLAVLGEGRETCPLCGLPKGPGEHRCPASNGHHAAS
ncbi:MAG: DUF3090 family protein [Actinomycetota bacterium]